MSSYTQPHQSSSQSSDQSFDQPSSQTVKHSSSQTSANPEDSGLSIVIPIPTNIAISLATLPMLAAVVSSQMVAHTLRQLGESSEELFRGDRLPTLPLLKL